MEALDIKYSRSSGPGGQHINKTESKVQVSFHLDSAEWIPKEIRQKLAEIVSWLRHDSISKTLTISMSYNPLFSTRIA